MNQNRPILFAANTPLPGLSKVTLYADTWTDHVLQRHPEMVGRETEVQSVLSTPTTVSTRSGDSHRVLFSKSGVTSPSGSPLIVAVDHDAATVCTAFFNRSFTPETVLWEQASDQGVDP